MLWNYCWFNPFATSKLIEIMAGWYALVDCPQNSSRFWEQSLVFYSIITWIDFNDNLVLSLIIPQSNWSLLLICRRFDNTVVFFNADYRMSEPTLQSRLMVSRWERRISYSAVKLAHLWQLWVLNYLFVFNNKLLFHSYP